MFAEARPAPRERSMHTIIRMARATLLALGLAACGAYDDGSDEEIGGDEAAVVDFAVGISDSDPETFTHPSWAGMNVHRARVVVPWDVAQRPPGNARRVKFEAWLAAAAAAGVEPYVTLGPSDLLKSGDKFRAPSASQ